MAQIRNDKSASSDNGDSAVSSDTTPGGKGRPTPTRREREAANMRPLVSNDRKAANKAARAKMSEAREKARIGMANGDERYLPQRDRGVQRKFVRDYVDARFSVGEALIPLMFVVILTTFVPAFATYSYLVLYVFFFAAVVDSFVLGIVLKKKIEAKFGEGNMQKGTKWYAAMRGLQLRPMRLPKPQVKRWKYPS